MSGHSPDGDSTVVDKKLSNPGEPERSTAYYIGIIVMLGLALEGPRLLLTLVTTACFGFTISGWAYVLPQLLQTPATPHGFGLTAWDVALWQGMPQGLGSMTAGVLAGFLARRYGPRIVLIGSGVFFAAPCLILAGSIGTDSATLVRTCAVMIGIATGFYFGNTQNLIVEAVPADRQGASGAMNFTAQSVFGGVASGTH
ncbi:MFS transporter [Gordonia sp. PDNC005]|uniref:MFS transporter n=1 Tax=unclassified Gordonia (in: high G+C Gram-positive bacteria) TaxID=2657482 RepID=UPI001964C607|nr:MFS transporter [Gordonia sp. PDNC005]QRY61875.1 MFS transporter [Gordonia sp. PDNC005]